MPRTERRARSRARLLVLALAAAALTVLVPAAHAGSVSRTTAPGTEGSAPVTNVTYVLRADGGGANRVTVRQIASGGTGLVISDSAGRVSPSSPDCTASGSGEVRCVAPPSLAGRRVGRVSVTVDTGDRDDRVRLGNGVAGNAHLGSGDDRALAADGGATLLGGSGDDRLRSGSGADLLDGGGGGDLLDAGAGADTVRGRSGNDRLFGGSGADRIDDGSGADRVFAESGADRILTIGSRRAVEEVSCGRGRDLVLGPERFVNVGRDCELTETGRGDRLFARPLRVENRALVFLAGCTKNGCLGSRARGAVVSVRVGAAPPGVGRLLGRRRYRVGLLGSREVRVRLSRAELESLRSTTSLEIRVAGMAFRVLIRVR